MLVDGTPDSGRAFFMDTTIARDDATLALNGSVEWQPGEGNVAYDLDINANNFPVADIASFLDFADLPVTGKLTGTLKIAGRKESLEGSGRVTVAEGTVMGEPIDVASADLTFTQGRVKATNLIVRSPAGEIRGEAEIDLAQERFSYTIASSSIDASKLKIAAGLSDLLGGRIVLQSTGAGTFTRPELVVEAQLEGATLRGLASRRQCAAAVLSRDSQRAPDRARRDRRHRLDRRRRFRRRKHGCRRQRARHRPRHRARGGDLAENIVAPASGNSCFDLKLADD
jgi:hypothetical protein